MNSLRGCEIQNIGSGFGPIAELPPSDPAIISINDNPAISINEYTNYHQPRENKNLMGYLPASQSVNHR